MKHPTSSNFSSLRMLGVCLALVTAVGNAEANKPASVAKPKGGDGVQSRTLTRETRQEYNGRHSRTRRQTLTTMRINTAAGKVKTSTLTQDYLRPGTGEAFGRRIDERTKNPDGSTVAVDVDEFLDGAHKTRTVKTTERSANGFVRQESLVVDMTKDNKGAIANVDITIPHGAGRPLDAVLHFARTDKRMLARTAARTNKRERSQAAYFSAKIPLNGVYTLKDPETGADIPAEMIVGFRVGESPRTMARRIASRQWDAIFGSQVVPVRLTTKLLVGAVRDSVRAFFMAP